MDERTKKIREKLKQKINKKKLNNGEKIEIESNSDSLNNLNFDKLKKKININNLKNELQKLGINVDDYI